MPSLFETLLRDWQAALTAAVVFVTLAGLLFGQRAPDMAMIGGVVVLLAAGVLTPDEAFKGMSNEGMLTVAALFVVAAAVERTGALASLVDRALGTSGSGTQFFIDRGRRLGHILDPRTGRPAEGVHCATVVAPSAADADALATALYVLGRDGLPQIAPRGGPVGAVLVVPDDGAGVRVVTANLTHGMIDLENAVGVTVEDTTATPVDAPAPS